jgi:hypothetical protein
MVDAEGRAFEPVIMDSSGHSSFHAAAIRALERSRFDPAMLNGKPIIGSMTVLYRFDLGVDSYGATQRFSGAYTRWQDALTRENRHDVEESLGRLEDIGATNHYENALLGLARYSSARLYGTEVEQIQHINQALSLASSPDDSSFLDEELVRNLRRALLQLQIRNNRFSEALGTFELMEASGDTEALTQFRDPIAALQEFRNDDSEYLIPLRLDEHGLTGLQLFKDQFAFIDGEGELNEVVLRCEREHVAFVVERDILYNVEPQWGDCSIQILGRAGADFLLLQQ